MIADNRQFEELKSEVMTLRAMVQSLMASIEGMANEEPEDQVFEPQAPVIQQQFEHASSPGDSDAFDNKDVDTKSVSLASVTKDGKTRNEYRLHDFANPATHTPQSGDKMLVRSVDDNVPTLKYAEIPDTPQTYNELKVIADWMYDSGEKWIKFKYATITFTKGWATSVSVDQNWSSPLNHGLQVVEEDY